MSSGPIWSTDAARARKSRCPKGKGLAKRLWLLKNGEKTLENPDLKKRMLMNVAVIVYYLSEGERL